MTTFESSDDAAPAVDSYEDSALAAIAAKVLWLSTAMIHHANRVRPNPPSGLKVGGHQASSASMVEIMTSLYFEHLRPGIECPSNPPTPHRCCTASIISSGRWTRST